MKNKAQPLQVAALACAILGISHQSHAQLESGLLNYWPFDNDTLDAAPGVPGAASSVADDGTFAGTNGTDGIAFGSGLFGSAGIELNGAGGGAAGQENDGYVLVTRSADTLFSATSTVTTSLWARSTGLDSSWQTLISHGEGSQYRLARRGGSNPPVAAYAGGSGDIPGNDTTGSQIGVDNGWHHIVGISEGGVSTRLWVDGTLVATGAAPSINDNGNGNPADPDLNIGANPQTGANNREWFGEIDDVAQWNRVLTDAEVAEIFTGGTTNGKSLADLLSPATGEDNENGGAGDGMDDGWEVAVGLDPDVDDSGENPDDDGLTNLEEWNGGDNPTDPFNNDSDDDDLLDGEEVNTHGTDPNDADSDDDGLSDGDEIAANTLPNDPDTDDDGFDDGYEVDNVAFGFDPLVDDSAGDADSDGLNNGDELNVGTDPIVADSDSDGTNDGDEVGGLVNPYDAAGALVGVPGEPTDPLDDDSDDDTVLDGAETDNANGSVTDPNSTDTDGDGVDDALEIDAGTDPTDPAEFPNIAAPTATMSWIASQDLDGDNLWPTVEVPEIAGIAWNFGAPMSPVFGLANLVTAWYSAPSATMQSFNDAPLSAAPFSQSTNQPASFELVFRPGDLIDNHLLFETGGNGDGLAFVLLGDLLEFRAQDANSVAQRIILNHTFTPGDEAQFQHVVATVQTGPAGTNMGVLYVNGVRVDTFAATGAVNDWAGGDDSGLGRVNGGTSTGQGGFAPFTGDIGLLRFYAGAVLIGPEVRALYDELSAGAADSDEDELPDGWEIFYFENLDQDGDDDPDSDRLTNAEELLLGSDPTEPDSDGDGIDDGDEIEGSANPYVAGVLAVAPGDPTNPINPDSDGDGVADGAEVDPGNGSVTDPNNPDTDGDLFDDGIEIDNDSDPTDANSLPDVPSITIIGGLLGGDLTDPENDANDTIACILPNCEGLNVILSTSDAADEGWSPGDAAGNEKVYDIFDNKVGGGEAKWCCNGAPQHATVEFEEPVSITHFTVTSSNDTPDRDPRDWQILGSNDGVNFEPIFTQAGDPQLWTARNQTIQVVLPFPSDAFKFIRYSVTRTNNNNHALNEIEYFGTIGQLVPLQISNITYNPATEEMSVTWNSKPGKDYGLFFSPDLIDWGADVNDSIPSGGDTTTFDFTNPAPGEPKLFFRVMEN